MNIKAIICTRTKKLPDVTTLLVEKLKSFGIKVFLVVEQTSIFEAYKKGFKASGAKGNDIVIFCHDDIELLDPKLAFISILANCLDPSTGIIGPAGAAHFDEEAIWWSKKQWEAGNLRGKVWHVDKEGNKYATEYGKFGEVAVLDGLFLAARAEVWEDVGFDKPEYFEGDWDFYDIHYTSTSYLKGYENKAVPIKVIHHSSGDLTGRESWFKNRAAFQKNAILPLIIL